MVRETALCAPRTFRRVTLIEGTVTSLLCELPRLPFVAVGLPTSTFPPSARRSALLFLQGVARLATRPDVNTAVKPAHEQHHGDTPSVNVNGCATSS